MNRSDARGGSSGSEPKAPGPIVCGVWGIISRVKLAWYRVVERMRYGPVPDDDNGTRPLIVVLDGVGRFQFAPYMIRMVCREAGLGYAVVKFDWQYGLVGEIWTDLMWLRRNRVQAARFARFVRQLKRSHPNRTVHLFAFSGGTGIATFAGKYLENRGLIETLILAQPALSPGYDLSDVLGAAKRTYVLTSERDNVILGLGTSLFGTTDRVYGRAAGLTGFVRPKGLPAAGEAAYDRCHVLRWGPSWLVEGHTGGHAGCLARTFLRRVLATVLDGTWDGSETGIPRVKPAEPA